MRCHVPCTSNHHRHIYNPTWETKLAGWQGVVQGAQQHVDGMTARKQPN